MTTRCVGRACFQRGIFTAHGRIRIKNAGKVPTSEIPLLIVSDMFPFITPTAANTYVHSRYDEIVLVVVGKWAILCDTWRKLTHSFFEKDISDGTFEASVSTNNFLYTGMIIHTLSAHFPSEWGSWELQLDARHAILLRPLLVPFVQVFADWWNWVSLGIILLQH